MFDLQASRFNDEAVPNLDADGDLLEVLEPTEESEVAG